MNLDEVKAYCREHKTFRLVENPPYFMACYNYHEVGVWNPFNREFRGLVFTDEEGIIARPYPKFFNLGEPDNKVSDGVVEVVEKIDGSMIACWEHDGKVNFTTKGSFNHDYTKIAEKIFSDKNKELIKDYPNYTIITENVLRDRPIVITYPQDDLYLIGLRRNHDGKWLMPSKLSELGDTYGFKTPYYFGEYKLSEFPEDKKDVEQFEGYVCYKQEDICKIKVGWYLERHGFLSNLNPPKIAQAHLDQTLDDFLPLMGKYHLELVARSVATLSQHIGVKAGEIESDLKEHKFEDRKSLGLWLKENRTRFPGVYWKIFDGMEPIEAFTNYCRMHQDYLKEIYAHIG